MGSYEGIRHPVLIIGAGPVGLTTAINIARSGIKVVVLERGDSIDQSPRATSYQPCVMAEMEESGILDDIKKKSMINNVLSFWIGNGPQKERVAYVKKMEGGSLFPAGINCGQPVLTETIMQHLLSRYNSEIKFNQRVEKISQNGDFVTVHCRDPRDSSSSLIEYHADWVVGADGAGSTTRKLLDIPFEGFSWPKEDFCASNVRYPFEKYGYTTANMVLDSTNWAVVTVIEPGLWRCAFGVRPGMTNDEIRAELDDHYKHIFPGWPGDGYELVQLNRYKPHQRCAAQFRKGKCFLVGDAAHSNNPIGGLGLTTGILDAGPLGRALAAVINKRAPDSILDIWAQARREKWLTYTNEFSIENKRLIQRGGYSEDPLGIWKIDEISAQHNMNSWIEKLAYPNKKEEDFAMYESFKDVDQQLKSRMKQWNITMDPLWMAEYEDPEVVERRIALRPSQVQSAI